MKKTNYLKYKGYIGSIDFSLEDNCLFGEVQGMRLPASISYEGTTLDELTADFENAVDTYLEVCKIDNVKPFKPFLGSFNIRIAPSTHREAVRVAKALGKTLNEYVKEAIEVQVRIDAKQQEVI